MVRPNQTRERGYSNPIFSKKDRCSECPLMNCLSHLPVRGKPSMALGQAKNPLSRPSSMTCMAQVLTAYVLEASETLAIIIE